VCHRIRAVKPRLHQGNMLPGNMFFVSATKLLPVCCQCPLLLDTKGYKLLRYEQLLFAEPHVSLNIYVSGYKLLVRATCCPGVNAALNELVVVCCLQVGVRVRATCGSCSSAWSEKERSTAVAQTSSLDRDSETRCA